MDYQLYTEFPAELENEWNELLDKSSSHVPFLRYEYLETWWQMRGGGEWQPECSLVIITARQNGKLAGIAPLFYTPDHQGKPCLMLLGSIEISDYLDLIAPAEIIPEFVRGLLKCIEQADLPKWQVLDLYNILDNSPTLAALEAAASSDGLLYQQEKLQHSPYIPLPGDWEAYLAGIDKKQRHEIRRKLRRAENAEVPVRWYLAEDAQALDTEIDAFLDLMKQDEDKAKFLTEPMKETMRALMHCAFENGCLQLAFLEVDGHKAAAYASFDYLNRIWVYNSGLNFSFVEYSPGWVLLGHLLKWANENGRSEFDFMRGDEDYKYKFGGIKRDVMRVRVER